MTTAETATLQSPRAPGALAGPRLTRNQPQLRFLVLWAVAWAVIGAGSGLAISFQTGTDLGPVLRLSLLFAETVGFAALLSARVVFPLWYGLPYLPSLVLQVVTLLGVSVFGSIGVSLIDPYFTLAKLPTVLLVVAGNASLALVTGIGLHTYDSMRRQIEASFEALREKEAMERELRVARDVQQELLPNETPNFEGLEVAGRCIPAVDVGGDYFDFLDEKSGRVGIVVADVAGKGVPAALLMSGLHASVHTLAHTTPAPAQLADHLNTFLCNSSSSSRYATFFMGWFDLGDRTFEYCNAGHHPPLLINARGTSELTGSSGLPIGLFEGVDYEESHQQLAPGDLLALFTDGVVESPDLGGEEFGEQRLIEALRSRLELPLEEIVDQVLAEVREWTDGEPFDDATLVLARVR